MLMSTLPTVLCRHHAALSPKLACKCIALLQEVAFIGSQFRGIIFQGSRAMPDLTALYGCSGTTLWRGWYRVRSRSWGAGRCCQLGCWKPPVSRTPTSRSPAKLLFSRWSSIQAASCSSLQDLTKRCASSR